MVATRNDDDDEKVVLLVGSCGLDRLLSVHIFPNADAKVRTTAYHEVGGGNAANTASAMALLKDAAFLSGHPKLKIKVLTKLGDDYVGKQLAQELEQSGVDISSPLFLYAGRGTTTSFTTIIVSDSEFTRTCIHTPGTCGELSVEDVNRVDMDDVFANVVHMHSDCRHTDASLVLAIEARKRGITVSVDAEKDRHIKSQHSLLELATTLFTNSSQLQDYFDKRTRDLETLHKQESPPEPIISECSTVNDKSAVVAQTLAHSVNPSSFYLRWHGASQLQKDVVITKGSMGAIRIKPESFAAEDGSISTSGENSISNTASTDENDTTICVEQHSVRRSDDNKIARYKVQTAGVLKNVDIVDTTGAGDAFIGGYLLSSLVYSDKPQMALNFGAWVGGRKLGGPGARSTLPKSVDVDELLGQTPVEVEQHLQEVLGSFGELVV
jgi:sugar/nucleoside kinase (ribokinase family)